ncbi:sporulation initiation phosphotransferase F [bacterium BMS3Bbin04]|nr:sporulation initiation phosphotransferase F [bacterium BMS3Bbin04]
MIVDDEPDISDFLSTFFRMKGYLTHVANSGQEAIDNLVQFNPHVILLDVRMPDMDGLETLKHIREIDDQVGVIMVTAVHEMNIGREALSLGAADFVTKPVDLEYLETTVMVKLVSLIQ